jgi:hypothetical protein
MYEPKSDEGAYKILLLIYGSETGMYLRNSLEFILQHMR